MFNPRRHTHQIFHLWIPWQESVTQLTWERGKCIGKEFSLRGPEKAVCMLVQEVVWNELGGA